MKTIKYIIAGAILATTMLGGMSLTSCSDLDEHPYTFIDPASFYNTEEEIDATLAGVYNRYRNMYNANSQLYLAQIELLTDQAVPTYNKNNMELINKWDGQKVKDAAKLKVDGVTGATFSSDAIIKNVQLALEYYQAHK